MWEQVRYNRTRTAMLIAGMGVVLLLLGIGLSIYIGGMYLMGENTLELNFFVICWIVASVVAYFQGDNIILALSQARKIGAHNLHRLYNIVEELKISSGLETMPSIYVIEDPALNAFAIGRDPNKAAVIVTTGLLTKLNRDELQGVIGHEIAHIKNRDVLLMALCVLLMGPLSSIKFPAKLSWWVPFVCFLIPSILTIITILSDWGLWLIFIFYLCGLIYATPVITRLIYYDISRRREYLADACSALYTRYPEGLASALEKIAASTDQVLAASLITAPMYIVSPFRKKGMAASDVSETHPPISERIRILRAMAHASYAEYDRAYREVRGTEKSVLPAYATALAGTAAIRPALHDNLDHFQRARETSNALWNARNYGIINCACGTRMRLPPSFKLTEVKCPHCGRINQVAT